MKAAPGSKSGRQQCGDERASDFSRQLNLAASTLGRVFVAAHVVPLIACFVVLAAVPTAAEEEVPITRPEDVGMSSERLERIAPAMKRLIDAGKIPGTVTVVARHGKVVHFEALGSRNIEAGQPMTRDTIFRIYSQTKP